MFHEETQRQVLFILVVRKPKWSFLICKHEGKACFYPQMTPTSLSFPVSSYFSWLPHSMPIRGKKDLKQADLGKGSKFIEVLCNRPVLTCVFPMTQSIKTCTDYVHLLHISRLTICGYIFAYKVDLHLCMCKKGQPSQPLVI